MEKEEEIYLLDVGVNLDLTIKFLKDVMMPLIFKKRKKYCPVIEQCIRELEDENTLFVYYLIPFARCYAAYVDSLIAEHKGKIPTEMICLFRFNSHPVNLRINRQIFYLRESEKEISEIQIEVHVLKYVSKFHVKVSIGLDEILFIDWNYKTNEII